MVVATTSGGGDDSQDIPEFSLCAALVGHTGDVRSLAAGKGYLYSGARDSVVMAWPLDEVSEGHHLWRLAKQVCFQEESQTSRVRVRDLLQ